MSRFVPNPRFEAELKRSTEMRAVVRHGAEAAAKEAKRLAPVDTGEYRASIKVVEAGDDARVVAGAGHAGYVEFGTRDTPVFAPLRRGTEAAGLRIGRKR